MYIGCSGDKVIFEQRPERREQQSHAGIWKKSVGDKGMASAKALRHTKTSVF